MLSRLVRPTGTFGFAFGRKQLELLPNCFSPLGSLASFGVIPFSRASRPTRSPKKRLAELDFYASLVDDPGLKEFILKKKEKIKPLGTKEGFFCSHFFLQFKFRVKQQLPRH